MVDLRKENHGPQTMQGVNLVAIAYDNRVAKRDGKVTTHYLDVRLHPGDRRAAGQTTLALVTKRDEKSPTGYNNSARYTAGQFEAIKEAAGDNATPLTNQAGEVVGQIYGFKADLLVSKGEGLIANTKTLAPSDLSVLPDKDGRDIRQQIFDSMAEAKAAREAAKATNTPEVEAQATEERELVPAGGVVASADEPELG